MDPRVDQMECAIREIHYELYQHDDLLRQLGGALFNLIKVTVANNDVEEASDWAVENGLAIIAMEGIDSEEEDDDDGKI